MPNHVTSICTVTGPIEEVSKFVEKHILDVKGNLTFSLNSVIPMPDMLRSTRAVTPRSEDNIRAMKETGYFDWYDWAVDNWGTKWDAYQFEKKEDVYGRYVFKFQTAWAFPSPVFEKLTGLYPNLEFAIVCFDEGWNFGGKGVFRSDSFRCKKELATPEMYREVYGEAPPPDEDEVEKAK